MQPTHVLRLNRTDEPNASVLLHVSSSGSNALDVKLVATEQEHIYHAAIRQTKLDSLRAKTYDGSDEQWSQILKYLLLRQPPQAHIDDTFQGLEIIASVDGPTVIVTVRKNIGGVTRRLGLIKLDRDDEREEISFPDWVETAARNTDKFQQDLENAQATLQSQKQQIEKLETQLDELIEAKKQHEHELFQKFTTLLNSKKLKIRDQQRLLATANVDLNTAEAVASSRSSRSARRAVNASQDGKRKRDTAEKQDVDVGDGTDGEDETAKDALETPEPSDVEGNESDLDMDLGDANIGDNPAFASALGNEKSSKDTAKAHGSLVSGRDKEVASTRSQSTTAYPTVPEGGAADSDEETDDEL